MVDSAQTPGNSGIGGAGIKMCILLLVICVAMAALAARLVWLQIIQSQYYKTQAVDNSTRVTFLRAPRGIIYDRNGNMLATNKQTLSMVAIPSQVNAENIDDLARKLSKILGMDYH
jgi:penicillin-binding protein 2